MDNNVAIKVENVSKKFCKNLKKSMLYGLADIGRNIVGLKTNPDRMRSDEFWAVDDVSFELKKGETLGLIGANGSGKTTLLKMLNGIFWPDKGKISMRGKVGALIAVGAGFHPQLTGRENIYVNSAVLGMNRREVNKKFDSIIEFADIGDFLDMPVKNYSSGMYVRLGFSVAVHCDPDILLVDEVLAVGDEGFQNKCFNKIGELKKNGTTAVLVSHNMHTISAFSTQVVFMKQGKEKYFLNVADGVEEYKSLFMKKEDMRIEKICSGNHKIRFFDINTNGKIFNPSDSFNLRMSYDALEDIEDIEIDTTIRNADENSCYFQATNKVYKKKIDLKKGKNDIVIKIEDIRINKAHSKIGISIWTKDRNELLFWWKIPVEFKSIGYSTGNNFLNVTYEQN